MSSEIENFREAVAKFDELQLELESIKEILESNFSNYQNISRVSNKNINDFESILKSINTLQINATNTVENSLEKANQFKGKIEEQNQELYRNIYKQLTMLKEGLNSIINDAVSKVEIDTNGFEKIINKKLQEFDISKVDEAIKEVHHGLFYLNLISKRMAEKEEGINTAIDNINDANFNLSLFTLMSSLGLGLIFGIVLSTVFQIEIFSDYYFSKYDEKQEVLDSNVKGLSKEIDKLNDLNKWLLKNKIEIKYGQFKDSNQHYILLKKEDTQEDADGKTSFYRNGNTVIFIKDFK
jgi:hypothetical protein